MRRSLHLLVVLLSVSCGGQDSAGGDCGALDEGEEQDHCYKQAVLAMDATQLEEVKTQSELIGDDMIRQYAVSTWVEEHANEISLEQGRVLCDLLEGRDASYCLRRLSSPHLQR